jgi:hypothetical protein
MGRGAAGLALDSDGDLLLGSRARSGPSTRLGETTTLLDGLGFAGDVDYDAARRRIVLDFGATAVTVVCPDADEDGGLRRGVRGRRAARGRAALLDELQRRRARLAASPRGSAHRRRLTAEPSEDGWC